MCHLCVSPHKDRNTKYVCVCVCLREFLCARVRMSECVCDQLLNGCLEESVNGFVEFCFRGTNRRMRSPRALVTTRECIVAVFKTWQSPASAQ